MRVIAFSCVHWMTRELQVDVYEYEPALDYAPFLALCDLILADPPDVVVNLGDFTESFYGDNCPLPVAYKEIADTLHVIKIAGNHDRDDGHQFIDLDGVRYEHGHKLAPKMPGADASVEGYIGRLRVNTAGMKVVHGHSHVPSEGFGLPLDVGSVTFSQTYGEIIDGQGQWRRIET